ncbi:MAG TPA: hypothetical protein VII01_15960 [Solirubrobacteraceae bacterium]
MRMLSVVLVVFALALAGCGSSSSSSSNSTGASSTAAQSSGSGTTHLATVRFVAHAGLAFGAFHRYIYKPLLAGDFKGLLRHKLAVVKATAAAAFIYHELKLASADTHSSAALKSLVKPLNVLTTGFAAALAKLKAGKFNLAEIETANIAISSIEGVSKNSGAAIAEQVPSLP